MAQTLKVGLTTQVLKKYIILFDSNPEKKKLHLLYPHWSNFHLDRKESDDPTSSNTNTVFKNL